MKELLHVAKLTQARALLHPLRVALLHHLDEPRTCRELSERVRLSPQRLNHHLKELLRARVITIVRSQQKGNLLEAVYQRAGKAVWFAPELAQPEKLAPGEARARLSLHNLLVLAETLTADVARLLGRREAKDVASFGFEAEVTLKDETERQAFATDVMRAFQTVLEKYGGSRADGESYKVMVTCYPAVPTEEERR